jgi:hypothetical protein
MPLFPPLTDTLRWDDLVRQGRSQLPLNAPGWTDQNISDPGIAVLELLSWLVEADGFRSGAVTDRERRLLLALAGFTARSPQPATCLVTAAPTVPGIDVLPRGLVLEGSRGASRVPLTLRADLAISGAVVAVVATTTPDADADEYRSGCVDLTRDRAAGRPFRPLGSDPGPGCALLIGLQVPPGGVQGDVLDLFAVADHGLSSPEADSTDAHHSAVTVWEWWDGAHWRAFTPDVEAGDSAEPVAPESVRDSTAALTRTGRIRLGVPAGLVMTVLGDQTAGELAGRSCAWLRGRLATGRHDAAPILSSLHVDSAIAIAAQRYSSMFVIPPGAAVAGLPTPATVPGTLPRAALSLVISAGGDVTAVRFDPPETGGAPASTPVVDVVRWVPPAPGIPGRLVADLAVLGVATGVPDESFRLPGPWCAEPPALWVTEPTGDPTVVRQVADLAVAGPGDVAAVLDPDGVTVRFGDGRNGRTLTPGATVLVAGRQTVAGGLGEIRPPMPLSVPPTDRTSALAGPGADAVEVTLLEGLDSGRPADDTSQVAARAESQLWIHDVITAAVQRAGGTSLDDLELSAVRGLGIPERAVTGPDLERIALATPGTTLWRARALPEADPRLPSLRADGCVTLVILPSLPVARPEPTAGLRSRVRARIEATRTLGTRVFVTGPDYELIGVSAELVLVRGVAAVTTTAAAERAIRTFLHPVTGGPEGRGWPFGRAVHRAEVLQLLDEIPGVDHVNGLALSCEPHSGDCGDVRIGRTQLVLAGAVRLTTNELENGS